MSRRPVLLVAALAVLSILVALPAVAADPSPSPGAGQGKAKGQQKEKVAETPISLTGTVAAATDAEGKTTYTLSSGGKTYQLDAGPSWYWGDKHPLKAFVGQSVKVEGSTKAGSTEVDVARVDGKAVRAAGKPPWAGGWKRVGKAHPGWSQEKADRFKAKFGDCFPPGQCKTKPNKGAAGAAEPTPSAGPD